MDLAILISSKLFPIGTNDSFWGRTVPIRVDFFFNHDFEKSWPCRFNCLWLLGCYNLKIQKKVDESEHPSNAKHCQISSAVRVGLNRKNNLKSVVLPKNYSSFVFSATEKLQFVILQFCLAKICYCFVFLTTLLAHFVHGTFHQRRLIQLWSNPKLTEIRQVTDVLFWMSQLHLKFTLRLRRIWISMRRSKFSFFLPFFPPYVYVLSNLAKVVASVAKWLAHQAAVRKVQGSIPPGFFSLIFPKFPI